MSSVVRHALWSMYTTATGRALLSRGQLEAMTKVRFPGVGGSPLNLHMHSRTCSCVGACGVRASDCVHACACM